MQNQQTLPDIVIEGIENMTDQQIQERLMQELQRLQSQNDFQPGRAATQVPGGPVHQNSSASVVDPALHTSGGRADAPA